jgi:trehalose/maltose hydrolase-like predicted phosphorylase
VVHAQLADMAGDEELSWKLYSDALSSDYNDIQGGTTAEGIHAGVMAGTVMIALSTYAGIDLRSDILTIDPTMPAQWKSIKCNLGFKKVQYSITISNDKVCIFTSADAKVKVLNETYYLQANKPAEIHY